MKQIKLSACNLCGGGTLSTLKCVLVIIVLVTVTISCLTGCTTGPTTKTSVEVYWAAQYGRTYHYDLHCEGLANAAEMMSGSIDDAKANYALDECPICGNNQHS